MLRLFSKVIFYIIIVFSMLLPWGSLVGFIDNKGDNSGEDKRYKELEEAILFGTSKRRLWVTGEVLKAKKYYSLIEYILNNEEQDEVLEGAISVVIKLKLSEYAPLMVKHLADKEPILVSYIVEGLGDLGYKAAMDDIISILEEQKQTNRMISLTCIRTLGKLKSSKATYIFYTLFKENNDYDIRYEIIKALELIGSTDSLPFLVTILDDATVDNNLKANVIKAIARCGGSFELIEEYSKNSNASVTVSTINALGLLRTKNTIEEERQFNLIFNALRNDLNKMRYAGLNAISQLEELSGRNKQRAIDIIKYMVLKDEDLKIRSKAIEVLSKIGGNRAKELWKAELTKSIDRFKIEIIKSLNYLDKLDAIVLLNIAFKSNASMLVKKNVIEKFFEIDNAKALIFADKNIMKVKKELSLKLYNITLIYKSMDSEKSVVALSKYISSPNMHIRRYTYNYLIQIGNEKSKQIVFDKLATEENSEVVLHILQLFYQKKLIDSLPLLNKSLIKSNDITVRKEAKRLIAYLKSI